MNCRSLLLGLALVAVACGQAPQKKSNLPVYLDDAQPLANAYILKNNLDVSTRFDIISIVFKNGEPVIEHIEDAFLP